MIEAAEPAEAVRDLPRIRRALPFGVNTSVFKVAGKMFALSQLAEHPLGVGLNCEPQLAEQWISAPPDPY